VLFSSREVADYINANYEPAWESVRAAPMVTIDFGNGHVVKRTLQGNVATYVCGPDGTVFDVLPGIYAPDIYRKQLESLKKVSDTLAPFVTLRGTPTDADRKRAAAALATKLREYHVQRERALTAPTVARGTTPQMQQLAWTGGFKFGGGFNGNVGGIGGFQGQQVGTGQLGKIAQTGGMFKGGAFTPSATNFGNGSAVPGFSGMTNFGSTPGFTGNFNGFQQPQFSGIEGPLAQVVSGAPQTGTVPKAPAGALASRPELKLDSEVNERIRRKAIHAHLAKQPAAVQPNDIKKWLFREVLHADLDDPKLGLGSLLDSNYPFLEEDRALGGKR
jgi:hypothetical protein